LAALKPSVLLADLNPLFDTAKSIVDEFDPAKFTAAIQSVFDDIQALLLQIDITQLLSPITDRLKELRDKLEAALQKTETAFNAMLASAPV
jgi:ABC-type transporter Mla subunit MlaD